MNKKKYYVGARFNSKSGGDFEIISVINSDTVKIRFLDEFKFEKLVSVNSIRKNSVKNPYKPTIFGVGYFGVGKYKSKYGTAAKGFNNTVEYNTWQNMLQRCYYSKYVCRVEGCVGYDDVEVCKDWHNFQNFADWYNLKAGIFKDNYSGRLHVDKDILTNNQAKIYSPDTCCLIPQEMNSFFIGQNRTKRTNLPSSIVKSINGYIISQLHGYMLNKEFLTLDEAVSFRDAFKRQILDTLIMKYFDVLEDRVITALIEYYK